MHLTEQQKQFFKPFGFLVLPELMADDVDWITAEFEGVFKERGVGHDAAKRTVIVPFID